MQTCRKDGLASGPPSDREPITVQYRFTLPDDTIREYRLCIDQGSLELIREDGGGHPDWVALPFQQCSHCPLVAANHPDCPVALGLHDVVVPMADLVSHQQVEVEVITAERRLVMVASAQRAISSVMGLVVATSACPHTAFLKPMARFHLPMASLEETLFRAVSTYLISQHFRRLDGLAADDRLIGLEEIYENLKILNAAMARRLRSNLAFKDAGINALIILDNFAQTVPMVLDDGLAVLRPLFEPFLHNGINK